MVLKGDGSQCSCRSVKNKDALQSDYYNMSVSLPSVSTR